MTKSLRLFTALTIGALVLFSCGGRRGGRGPGSPREAASKSIPVHVETLSPQSVDEYAWLSATVEPWNDSQVTFQVGGVVKEVLVREGQTVKQGQPLALLDDQTQRADLNQAKGARKQAQLDFERMKTLFASNAVSQQEYERAQNTLNTANAAYARSSDKWEDTRALAPFDGTVDRVDARVGARVTPGSKVAYLLSAGRLRANIAIPESDVIYLNNDSPVELFYQRFNTPELSFRGEIRAIAAQADSQNHSYRAIVDIKQPGPLRAGMVLKAKILRRSYQDAILIPLFALIPQEQGYSVFINSDGVAKKRDIELGPFIGEKVVVASGLAKGEQLVLEGQQFLSEGAHIEVIPQQTA